MRRTTGRTSWPDPDRFDPTRFVGTRPSPFTFFPFGGGVRRCLGAAFATYEMKIVLTEVLSRVDLRIASGYRMRPRLRGVTVGALGWRAGRGRASARRSLRGRIARGGTPDFLQFTESTADPSPAVVRER